MGLNNGLIALFLCCLTIKAPLAIEPSNPNADPATRALFQYLCELGGKGILAGQESMMWDHSGSSHSSKRDQYVFQKTGKYPALYASDFGDVTAQSELPERIRVVNNALLRHKEGAIISLSWHAVQPDQPEHGGYKTMNIGNYSSEKIDQMLTNGHAMQLEWFKRLDAIAEYLKILQNNGVPVLWRPFHEMNGSWFWWCRQPRYKELWIQMYKRFTEYHKLNNLLWVYSVNYYSEGDSWYKDMYPGNQYVDILGVDVYIEYGHSYAKHIHDDLIALGGGRPIGITENGKMPDIPTLKTQQPKYVFWCTWWGFEGKSDDDLYKRNYSDPYVITEDEVKIGPFDPNRKTINVTAKGKGIVLVNPSAASYEVGQSVKLTAVADSGFEFSSWEGDVSSTANPLTITINKNMNITAVFGPKQGTNLVVNGDFSKAISGWSFGIWEGAQGQTSVNDGVFKVTINNSATQWWHVQLTQQGIALLQGVTYKLSFKAWADSPRKIFVKIGEEGGAWADYGLAKEVQLNTTAQTFELSFTMNAASDDRARLEFNFGGPANTASVYLDDITLIALPKQSALQNYPRYNSKTYLAQNVFEKIPGTCLFKYGTNSAVAELKIIDLFGREKTFVTSYLGHFWLADVSSLPAGTYIAKILLDNIMHEVLFVKN